MSKKVALIIDYPCEDYMKRGNTTILAQEQEDFTLELMGLKHQEVKLPLIQKEKDDDEVLEVNLMDDAVTYSQISNGALSVVIGRSYEQFGLPSFESYNADIMNKFNIIIAFKNQQEVIDDILKQKFYHIYFVIPAITQFDNHVIFPVQSTQQFKYQEIHNQYKQIALVHYSNYQMRVDEIESLAQINEDCYIRRNMMRLQCLWRELLTQIGKFPKYGA